MTDTLNSSDSIYHRLFSHPEMVADLLRNFLDPAILAELDLSQMKRLNTKFTAKTGQRRRGDLVWEIPLCSGGNLFVLLVLEFQSEIDEWMVLRLDVYAGLLYQQLVDERKLKTSDGLPPILPIVLFNGEPRWNASTRLRDLIRLPAESPLWHYQPEMRYYTIDEGRFLDEELKVRHSLMAIFMRMGHPLSPESILDASHDLMAWFACHPDGPPVKQLFRELLTASLGRFKGPIPFPSIPEDLEEVVNMLASHVEKWSKDIEQKGRKDGEVSILTRLLQHRFGLLPTWVNEKIAAANLSYLEKWSLRLLDAQSLDEVFSD
ncbi:MAG: Rpn family recombination-promoting nuclease/putative transposase [Magnetococcales bacterium]|nr:Rpn family recombination-promoting nuclease/putative transposase [Magnetococcales bacterium]